MHVRHKGLALAVLALTQLMIVLDASIVNVALPAIQHALNFSSTNLQWIVNAYTLVFGGFLLLGGRFADRLGRKRIFMIGLLAFVAASALGGAAQSSGMLVAARALQGLGGALMSPAALSLLTVIFDEGAERNKALGIWGAIAAGGAAIGLLMGGILVQFLNWRWVFFVNIPIALLAIAGAVRFVPESKDPDSSGFDIAGAFTVTLGLVTLVYALVRGNAVGWATFQTLGTLALSAVLLISFINIEGKGSHPLLPLRMFRNRNVVGADSAILFLGAAMFGMFFYISLYLQEILGFSPLKTGFAFLPVSLVIMISAGIGSHFLTTFGPRRVATFGLSVAPIGMLLLMRIHPHGNYVTDVLLPLMVLSLGLGAAFVSLTAAAVSGVDHADSGLASAMLNTAQQVGGALGLAGLTAISTARYNHVLATSATQDAATTSGWAWGFGVCAALMAIGAIISATTITVSGREVAETSEEEMRSGDAVPA
jgi:EmrB/QacA subfamily drug resistance transporter